MRIGTASDAAAFLSPLFSTATGELVAVLHLDAHQRMTALTLDGVGTPDEVELPVGDILGRALKLGSSAFIVAHNHPSGDPTPSEADLDSTQRLLEAGAAVGVRLFDHLIFAAGEWRSFRALGLL